MSNQAEMPDIHGYRVESILNQDENVTLYKAVDLALNQLVTIKVFKPEFFADASFRDAYFNEVGRVREIHHQNIASILDVIHDGDRHCIVMEHLESTLKSKITSAESGGAGEWVVESNVIEDGTGGSSISAEGQDAQPITEDDSFDVALQVAQGLKVIHGQGLVHRNVSSQNIMFRLDGTPVLTNFAIIPSEGAGFQPATAQPPLDPHYMSPEQLMNSQVDGRSDIYSLGIVLYEMLTGTLPFVSDGNGTVEDKHKTTPIPELPGELKNYQLLLEQMLAKETEYRIQDAQKLVILLESPGRATSSGAQPQSEVGSQPLFESKQQIDDFTKSMEDMPMSDASTEMPDQAPRSFHKSPYKDNGESKSGFFSDIFADPVRIVLVVVAVFLLGLTAYFFTKSSGGEIDLDTTGNTQVQANQGQDGQPAPRPKRRRKKKAKTPEQIAKDNSYNEHVQKAQDFLEAEEHAEAFKQVVLARAIKKTKQLATLEAKIKESKKQKAKRDFAQYLADANTEYEAGNYSEAKSKLLMAKEIKSTYESMELEQNIEQKLAEQAEKDRFQERVRLAEERKEDEAYRRATLRNSLRSYQNYLRRYPKGRYVVEAQNKIANFQTSTSRQPQIKQSKGIVKVTLRRNPQPMSKNQVMAMLKQRNFFDNLDNKAGDFANGFERKVVNGDTVVIDNATGLMWLQSGAPQHMNYGNALDWVARLNQQGYAGYKDWRLPTLEEGASLLEPKLSSRGLYVNSVFSSQQRWIWTSDIYENDGRWLVRFNTGDVYGRSAYDSNYVRLVRSIR